MKIKKDCFGYDNGRCNILKETWAYRQKGLICTDCKFYKTAEKHKADLAKSEERLKRFGR